MVYSGASHTGLASFYFLHFMKSRIKTSCVGFCSCFPQVCFYCGGRHYYSTMNILCFWWFGYGVLRSFQLFFGTDTDERLPQILLLAELMQVDRFQGECSTTARTFTVAAINQRETWQSQTLEALSTYCSGVQISNTLRLRWLWEVVGCRLF